MSVPYNAITTINKEQPDKQCRHFFLNFLENKGFSNLGDSAIIDPDGKFAGWDVSGTWNGKVYEFELKARRFPYNTFNDNTCERHKLDVMGQHISEGKCRAGYIVSTFTDGVMAINNINDYYTTSFAECPKTTAFEDNSKVTKELIHFKFNDNGLYDMQTMELITDLPF